MGEHTDGMGVSSSIACVMAAKRRSKAWKLAACLGIPAPAAGFSGVQANLVRGRSPYWWGDFKRFANCLFCFDSTSHLLIGDESHHRDSARSREESRKVG